MSLTCAIQGPCPTVGGGRLWSENRTFRQPPTPRPKGLRPTSGGRQRQLYPLAYGAKTFDAPRLETVQGRPPGVRGGPWPPKGPRKPPKRRRTRPGAPGRADRAKGALGLGFRAPCQPSNPRNGGPSPTSGGRLRRSFLAVYGAKYSDDARLEAVQGRPPKGEVGRGPARHGRLSPGQGALVGVSRHLERDGPLQNRSSVPSFLALATSATQGRVRPRGDACDDRSSRFMVQVHLTVRVLRRCKGVLPRGRSDAARRAYALVSGPRGHFGWNFAPLAAIKRHSTGPHPTSGGRRQRLFLLVYGARYPEVPRLETLQGRPPGGRSDAARRAYALDSGPGCALDGVWRVLAANKTRAP